jgi:membrane protein implicated in regulation of membrane protease activity
MVLILILLLIAAAAGVLGTVLEAALIIVLSLILAFAVLVVGTVWYLRYRVRRFVRDADRYREASRRGGSYPARGTRRPIDDDPDRPPELPPT